MREGIKRIFGKNGEIFRGDWLLRSHRKVF
jgi:hypothetical protein